MRTAQTYSEDASRGTSPHLSREQHELLLAALSQKIADDCFAADSRSTIRRIVSSCPPLERPEQVLIAFKNSLDDVANNLRIPFSAERNTLLTGLVTAFIEEMYASAPAIRDSACRGK
jgi:hypothetical protein